jgi:hypothetical protein
VLVGLAWFACWFVLLVCYLFIHLSADRLSHPFSSAAKKFAVGKEPDEVERWATKVFNGTQTDVIVS